MIKKTYFLMKKHNIILKIPIFNRMRFYSTFHDSYVLRHIRKPYTLRNSITGSVLFGFAVGVCKFYAFCYIFVTD